MPYTPSDAPDYVRAQVSGTRLRQWCDVFNETYARCIANGRATADCESSSFAQANSVAGIRSQR